MDYSENDSAETRLKRTFFVVEATDAEEFMLWEKYSMDSAFRWVPKHPRMGNRNYNSTKWVQKHGWGVQVGELDSRHCWISVTFQEIDGRLIMFWSPTSQVSDSVQSEAWIDANFSGTYDGDRKAKCDANNFHICINAIKEANASLNKVKLST